MKLHFKTSILCIALLVMASGLVGCKQGASTPVLTDPDDIVANIRTQAAGMQLVTYGEVAEGKFPETVIVWLHGDVGYASVMERPAKAVVGSGIVSINMARPGCSIKKGNGPYSTGYQASLRGNKGIRDQYTQENIDYVAGALRTIKEQYRPGKLVVVGHSGGAATTALILGQYPDIIDRAVLIALPSDMHKWRQYRMRHAGESDFSLWAWNRSLSPVDYTEKISKNAEIVVVTGAGDTNTPPWLAQLYVSNALAAGANIKHVVIPGATHRLFSKKHVDIVGSPEYENVISAMLTSVTTTAEGDGKKKTN